MILGQETKNKFGYNINKIKKFSKNVLIVKCDNCNTIFEKESFKIFMARKNSKSEIDVCNNIECIKWKRENTMIKKYGVINAGLSKKIRKKVQTTCLKRYGVKEALLCKEIKSNAILGCINKYGVDNVFKSEEIKEKIKQTNLKKYGVEYNSQSDTIQNKKRENNIVKYGVKHPMMIKEISNKVSKTWLKIVYNKLETNLINPNFTIDEFIGFNKNITYPFQCKLCGNIFHNNYMGVVCYKCHPQPRSNIENELKQFVNETCVGNNDIKTNCRKEFDNKFEVDVYIPHSKIAIELDGLYWHSEKGGGKNERYHLNKTLLCESKNIHLIHIFEDEWLNTEKSIKSKLLNILSGNIDYNLFKDEIVIKNNLYYLNRRWFNKKDLYTIDNNQLQYIKETPPNIFYLDKKNYQSKRYTSIDNLKFYDRIWDCGYIVYG